MFNIQTYFIDNSINITSIRVNDHVSTALKSELLRLCSVAFKLIRADQIYILRHESVRNLFSTNAKQKVFICNFSKIPSNECIVEAVDICLKRNNSSFFDKHYLQFMAPLWDLGQFLNNALKGAGTNFVYL